jgi:hypothetical protein
MSLAPLLLAPFAVQIHAFGAVLTLILAIIQLLMPKGNTRDRVLGYVWAADMMMVAISSFWINGIRWWGQFWANPYFVDSYFRRRTSRSLRRPPRQYQKAQNRHVESGLLCPHRCGNFGQPILRPHHGTGVFRFLSLDHIRCMTAR